MKTTTVPHTKAIQHEFPFHLVKLDPDLQAEVAHCTPEERRRLAVVYRKYAHQLEISASVLEKHSSPWRRRALPRFCPRRLPWN